MSTLMCSSSTNYNIDPDILIRLIGPYRETYIKSKNIYGNKKLLSTYSIVKVFV